MNKIHILDCTLRDGGYCNQWEFGFKNTKKIIKGLVDAKIDIIECGFLTNKISYNEDITKFTNLEEISKVIPQEKNGKIFVALINYGEYSIDDIPYYDGTSIDGIRIAFHKKNIKDALEFCTAIKKKGYKVFVQPMVSLNYSDEEFISLIQQVNDIKPYAFYIVDSFGMMKKKNLIRLFYMIEHNLDEEIWIGFHSHNNMQMAYSNAQSLVEAQTSRNLILDSSIHGMGRGAGNLNTELFVEYLNDSIGSSYELKPLLNIIDEILSDFYQKNYWGYSLPNYLSASYNAHPNYASYFSDKNTLTVEAMDEIFSMMNIEKRVEFDKEYAEKMYVQYMEKGQIQINNKTKLKEIIKGKKVLLIAPGKSSEIEKEKIIDFAAQKDVITISINFDYQYLDTDFIFLSNLRRFRELDKNKRGKCIVTSNITASNVYLQTKYHDLLNNIETIRDNAGMMAIKFLSDFEVEHIVLAGFDGYSYDIKENYVSQQISFITKNALIEAMNKGMCQMLKKYKEERKIEFLTVAKNIVC